MIFGFAPIARTFQPAVRHTVQPATPRKMDVLRDALKAIYRGNWDDAENAITIDGAVAPHDPALLNLLGVVCQGRRDWKGAKRFFGKAMRANRSYAPAEQNLRRIYELCTFGRTALPVVLVDSQTAIHLALNDG